MCLESDVARVSRVYRALIEKDQGSSPPSHKIGILANERWRRKRCESRCSEEKLFELNRGSHINSDVFIRALVFKRVELNFFQPRTAEEHHLACVTPSP